VPRDEPRLPRSLEDGPEAAPLRAGLQARAEPLWAGGEGTATPAGFAGELRAAVVAAFEAGRGVRGLESAARALAGEARGQALADRRSGAPRGGRVSRLLLLSDDGAERFLRGVDSLLREHEPRVLALRLDTDAAGLGAALFGEGAIARALLIVHKEAVAAVLRALARQWEEGAQGAGRGA